MTDITLGQVGGIFLTNFEKAQDKYDIALAFLCTAGVKLAFNLLMVGKHT
jgi:hypothetical protein